MDPSETRPTRIRREARPIATALELVVRSSQGVARHPVVRTSFCLGEDLGVEGPAIRFRFFQDILHFEAPSGHGVVLLNGSPARTGRLAVGDRLAWDDSQLEVCHLQPSLRAVLEGLSDPFRGRVWSIGTAGVTLGRAGRRDNDITLEHPTVSREHATLLWGAGGAQLLNESSNSLVVVGGEVVASGTQVAVSDGALLEIGDLVFRFRMLEASSSETPRGLLQVRSMGGLAVIVGEQALTEQEWTSMRGRCLLARLALEWGGTVGLEPLVEEMWPDQASERGRLNLNSCLFQLRKTLQTSESGPDLIIRTRQGLQLDPQCLGNHDVIDLRSALQQGFQCRRGGHSEQACTHFEKALQLYRGPYLEGYYWAFAERLRSRLELETLEGARYLLHMRQQQGQWDQVVLLANRILSMDPCCQQSYAALLQACVEQGNPQQAVRHYEAYCKSLRREMNADPAIDVMREYQRALGAL